jgi:hypothetical protein
MLQAMAKKITWLQAAEILGISDPHMRRWRESCWTGGGASVREWRAFCQCENSRIRLFLPVFHSGMKTFPAAPKIYALVIPARTLDVGTNSWFAFGYLMLLKKACKMQAHMGNGAGEIIRELLS